MIPGSGGVTVPGLHRNWMLKNPPIVALMTMPPELAASGLVSSLNSMAPAGPAVQVWLGWVTVTEAGVAVSSPEPGTPSGSLIVVCTETGVSGVCWMPSTVFVPSMKVVTEPGMVFNPTTSRPRL